MSSPWSKISTPEPTSLRDIMSEEVARDLQAKEDQKYEKLISKDNGKRIQLEEDININNLDELDEDSDAVIARMLQKQFDEEYDDMLTRTEEKFNGASKVSISFSNFRRVPQTVDFDSDSEEEETEDLGDKRDWDRFDNVQRECKAIPPCGYVMKDGNMITKHDITLTSRNNACKFMSFPPEFHTGDGAGFDLKLSNKVFNSLKLYSKNEESRRQRFRDRKEDHATAEFGVDEPTRLKLYKLINKGMLVQVNGVVSIGKEAVILHADCDQSYTELELPKECVIKVFKTTLAEFKHREKYIRDDFRFKDRIGKQPVRKTIYLWAEKEMHNLYRLRKAGIPCPDVISLQKHILLMSFIGENHLPAPKLKEAVMSMDEYILAYDQIVETMKMLFTKARLIHADLSEYNILWHRQQCYFIDVSQSIEPSHPDALQFLMRDCENVINFFSRKNVPGIIMADELFTDITGYDYNNKVALEALQNTFKIKPHLVGKPGMEPHDAFETTWEQIQMGRLPCTPNMGSISEVVDQGDSVSA